ncbi:MAG: hypothetical protein LBI53_08265 [Candidatus Peribacteria bacterium]|jgi:hypothetical protein|nr:hypothetical protein [Candidatus Peribacteria bacterium]
MKKPILIAILLGISPAITLADLLQGDCDVVVARYPFSGNINQRTPEIQTGINTEKIIEKDAIVTAFLNLKKKCCEFDEFKIRKGNAESCKKDQDQ